MFVEELRARLFGVEPGNMASGPTDDAVREPFDPESYASDGRLLVVPRRIKMRSEKKYSGLVLVNKNMVDGSILSVVDRRVLGNKIVRLSIVYLVGNVLIGENGIVFSVIGAIMGWTFLVGSVVVFRKILVGAPISRMMSRGI